MRWGVGAGLGALTSSISHSGDDREGKFAFCFVRLGVGPGILSAGRIPSVSHSADDNGGRFAFFLGPVGVGVDLDSRRSSWVSGSGDDKGELSMFCSRSARCASRCSVGLVSRIERDPEDRYKALPMICEWYEEIRLFCVLSLLTPLITP